MGIAALILGIIGFILGLIPGCGIVLGGIPALVGLILAIISISKKKPKKNMAIAGLVLSILAFIAMMIMPVILGIGTYILNSSSHPIIDSSPFSNLADEIGNSKEYSAGQTYKCDDFSIKFVSCDTNFTSYNSTATVRDGYKVVKAEFEFENKSETVEYVSSYKFDCYADDISCSKFYSVSDASFSKSLDKGEKARGTVYFEVPNSAKEIIINYSKEYGTNKKINFKVK